MLLQAPRKKTLVKPDYFAHADVNANDLRQAGTFTTRGCEMLIPIFPPPSMAFDESVYIDLISHIKRQTLTRVSSSSVNVIPWCDSFHAHLYGELKDRALSNHNYWHFFKRRFIGVEKGGVPSNLPAWMEMLCARKALIPLSLPVICFINVVFQDQTPAVRGNKFEYMHKKQRIQWQGSKQLAKSLYVCLNHAKTQAGMLGASRSPCFAGWQKELIFGLWCFLFWRNKESKEKHYLFK